ncbi:MAG: hypothetical protein KDI09_17245 [Halioglobus sp.]|nr:hypothetical protein [Halioglobus sp.]
MLGSCHLAFANAQVPVAEAQAEVAAFASGEAPVRSYVVTEFSLVMPTAGSGDCPDGFNQYYSERFLDGLSPQERERYEEDPRLLQQALAPWYYDDPDSDPCANPSAFPDPGMLIVEGPRAMPRLEADGTVSERLLPPSQCPAPEEFERLIDGRAIDNQYARVMGCVKGYQPSGQAAAFEQSAILDGSMTILLEIEGLSGRDDDEVEVRFYSSDESVTLGTNGKPLPWATFAPTAERRFHNVTSGRVRDGVLTTDRFDLRLIKAAQRLDSELVLRDARLRLELEPEGAVAHGYLGGYWDLEWLAHAGIRIQDRTGLSSGKPAADTHGYTCEGKYHAVHRLADGHPDSVTGDCTSISVLHRLRAVPAFVIAERTGAGAS